MFPAEGCANASIGNEDGKTCDYGKECAIHGGVSARCSANIADHSQIVRFISTFISGSLVGKVRAGGSMGVVLLS